MAATFDQFNKQREDSINWRELFERYIQYWKWIAASALFFVIVGYLYNRSQPDNFSMQSSVLVVDQSRSGGMNEMSLLKQLDIGGMTTISNMVNNENEVIRSVNLMEKVVEELSLHTSYYRTRFLKTTNMYRESPYRVQLDSLSRVNLEFPLLLEVIPAATGSFTIKGKYDRERFTLENISLPALLATPAGAVSIELRPQQAVPDYTVNVRIFNTYDVARYITNNVLTTSVPKQVDVINLSVEVDNKVLGRDMLNTLIHFYNQDAIDQLNRSANNTKQFIDDRLKLLTDELSTVERSVEDYKQVNELTDIETNAGIFLERSSEYDQKRLEVETQLSLIKLIEEFVSQPANYKALIPNLGLTDVGLIAVITKYNELLMLRERVSEGGSDENPAYTRLSHQINATRQAIRTSIANSRKGLELTNRELLDRDYQSQRQIRELPRKEREFIEIKRQQQVKETLYLFLLQKREEASLSMAVNLPKGTILNRPKYAEKTGPRTIVNLLLFFVLGIVIPVIVVFIRDLINTSITSRAQLEKLTKVPILSELGHNTTGETLINHESVTDSNTELFRLLRTKIQFTLHPPHEKVMLVTSTEPGEGKSFVSMNLAISLATAGRKVIILGLDLRKPQLKKQFGLGHDRGMSSYLAGQETDYHALIQRIPAYPSLDIIAAGIIPPNPNELLISKRLDQLIDELKQHYDYIVIDTAPVGAVSDTFLIDRVVDVSLYIVRMDYSDKRNLEYLNHIYEEKTLRRPYIIMNDIQVEGKYYYHRGYSYGYGKYYGKHKHNE